jgi:site-specific DNA recombinase
MTNDNNKAARYGEYLRKSTDDKEKQVLSLGSQRDVIDRLKRAHNLIVIETIEEKMSAKRPGRPGFASLIKLIKTGNIDGVITWAPHRLSRNSVDIGEIIHLFDTGLLKEIVTESHTYRNNPMDIFMLGFHCLQAKFENDNKAIDVKGGMARCAKLGIYPGCPPLGYLPDKAGIKGARKRNIDPVNFPIVRKMWDLMLAGTHTPYQVLSKAIKEWGFRTRTGRIPSKSTTYKIFHNPCYYGDYEYPKRSGVWHKGIHQPMITRKEFERVQKMMRKPDNARPISKYFAYGGCTLHCGECGGVLSGMEKIKKQKNGNVHRYVYYGCTKRRDICKQMPVKEIDITVNTKEILSHIQIPTSLHDLMMDWVREENNKQFEGIYAQNDANKKTYEMTLKRIDGLIDMGASGLITDMEFQERRAEIDKEKDRLLTLIKDTEENVATWLDTADRMLTFVEFAAVRFDNAPPELQRGILLSLGWNLPVKDRRLDLTSENWIVPIKRIAKRLQEQMPPLEPLLPIECKGKIEKLLKSPYMCSLLQDVRNFFIKNHDRTWFPVVDEW